MDDKRRDFLKTTSRLLLTGAVISMFPLSFMAESRKRNQQSLTAFHDLSTALTANTELTPEVSETYFNYLLKHDEDHVLANLLKKVTTFSDHHSLNDYIRVEIRSHSPTGELLKRITSMWYTGSDGDHTISAEAYKQSLLWRPFGSLPRGIALGNSWNKSPFIT